MRTTTALTLITATTLTLNPWGLTKTEVTPIKELLHAEASWEVDTASDKPADYTDPITGDEWSFEELDNSDEPEFGLGEGVTLPPEVDPYPAYAGMVFEIDPCETDGPGIEEAPCYWDASERGNGKGSDFILWTDGTFFYREG